MKAHVKRASTSMVIVVAMLLASQAFALAEVVEGRVARLYPSTIDLVVYDPNGRPFPNSLPVQITSKTKFTGIKSIKGLKLNDAVGATIRQNESKVWIADSVTRFQQINAQPATRNPSPTLRDFLGSPVIKGALTGATSGALASGMSGGKAGKGALIGAGVGAAAGLLEGLFSQPAQPQRQSNSGYVSDSSYQQ